MSKRLSCSLPRRCLKDLDCGHQDLWIQKEHRTYTRGGSWICSFNVAEHLQSREVGMSITSSKH